jgi:hypothetical protein
MDVSIGEMTSTVRTTGSHQGQGKLVSTVLAALREEQEHAGRVHAERWIPCCAACAEEAEGR